MYINLLLILAWQGHEGVAYDTSEDAFFFLQRFPYDLHLGYYYE